MANSTLNLAITIPTSLVPGRLNRPASEARQEAETLVNLLMGMASGAKVGAMSANLNNGGGVAASGTLTLSSSVATDTIALSGVTFTEVASGAVAHQWNHGTTDTITAANLASALNADPVLSLSFLASSVGAVVTVTNLYPGLSGNYVPLVGSTNIVASGSTLSGGTGAVNIVYHFGL